MDISTSSGIENLVNNYRSVEMNRRLLPLQQRKEKFSTLSLAWSNLSSKLSTFKSTLKGFQTIGTDSIFNSKSALSTNNTFVSATAGNTATVGAYRLRVNQLAKSDMLVSNTMTSATAVTNMEGTHTFQITSGDYVSNVEVDLTDAETNETLMTKINSAINSDKAIVNSASLDSATTFNGTGSFTVNVDGTETTIDYDYSAGSTYDEVMDDLVTKINDVTGLEAEKVVDGSNVSLKITTLDSDDYITIDASADTGGLLGAGVLNIDVDKEKGASGIATAGAFNPNTGNSKFSLSAKETGYDNRLQMSDTSGTALAFMGLDSTLLTNRTMKVDDNTAGFIYNANSTTDNELNSRLEFNGINVQRNSNVIDDLANGMTFNLLAEMEGTDQDVDVSVKTNDSKIKEEIDKFIKDFNEIYNYVKSRSTTDKDTKQRGIFVGNATANSLMRSLSSSAMNTVPGMGTGISHLNQLGISFDPSSGLSVSDSSKLTSAIQEKPEQLQDFFNSENGIATTLYNSVENYLGAEGTISNLTDAYDKNVTYLQDKMESTNTRIEKSASLLRKRYQAMQADLFTLTTTFNYLNQTGLFKIQ